jgi:tRNA (cytidine32/guanosine34-2'-O)-methyltransferase
MIKHLREIHPTEYASYLQDKGASQKEKLEQIKTTRQLEEEIEHGDDELAELQGTTSQLRKRPVTTPITKYFSKAGPMKFKSNSDMQRRAEMDIAIYLVTGNLPFNHIESKAFRRFMAARDPKVRVRSRSSLVKTTLPLLERNLVEAKDRLLQEHLPKVVGAAFTSDIWSSRGQHSYLSLTMHFVDGNWRLHNLVMGVKHLQDPSHTGQVIAEKIDSMLEEIPLPSEATITFTTDGASSMAKAMRESPLVHDHLVCICHTISNCLQEALHHPDVAPAIKMLQDLAAKTHMSIKKVTAIRRACNELDSKLPLLPFIIANITSTVPIPFLDRFYIVHRPFLYRSYRS